MRRGFLTVSIATVDGEPARIHQHLALGLKRLTLDSCNARRLHKLRRRIEHGEETFDDKIVEFLLNFVERFWLLERWNNRKVIRNLRVIEDTFVWLDPSTV